MSSIRPLPRGIVLLAAALLPAAAAPVYPPRTLVLFVASWCAPCRAELRQFDAIAAAAAPLEVRVAPLDWTRGTAAMLRTVPAAHVWRSARVAEAFAQHSGGLPFSLMTDAEGRICATHDRALDPAAVRAMRRRCEGTS